MKLLCPNCKQTINLPEVESHGGQMERCGKCSALVHGTYEQRNSGRKIWDVHLEKPPAPKKKPCGCGCGTAILIVIAIIILIAMARCDWRVPDKPPDDAPAGQFQN